MCSSPTLPLSSFSWVYDLILVWVIIIICITVLKVRWIIYYMFYIYTIIKQIRVRGLDSYVSYDNEFVGVSSADTMLQDEQALTNVG